MVVFDSSLAALVTMQVKSGSHFRVSDEEYQGLNVNSRGL